jgi:hypothetical protein
MCICLISSFKTVEGGRGFTELRLKVKDRTINHNEGTGDFIAILAGIGCF